MAKKKKSKKKLRNTEKIIFFILVFSILVFISAILFAFVKNSETVWAYLLPSVGVLASSAFAVFTWKEKNENLPKILENPNYDRQQLEEQIRQEVAQEFGAIGNNSGYY